MRVALGTSLALAVAVMAAVTAGAAMAPVQRATLANVGPSTGPPSTPLSYRYSWDYRQCVAAAPGARGLLIVLRWDNWPTALGTGTVTVSRATGECDGLVGGTVPAPSSPGAHRLTAYLSDPVTGGRVQGSTAVAQPFVVTSVPTPAPTPSPTPKAAPPSTPKPVVTSSAAPPRVSPSPSPSPSATPPPTDTPAATPSPTGSPAPAGAGIVPSASGGSGGVSPPGGWLLDLTVAAVALAAVGIAMLVGARLRRPGPPDPFEFVR